MDDINNDGGGEHWSQGFESDSITAESREAFVSANSKYATQNDAIMGGYNAQKAMGKPFRVPESMDSLPDDASRDDFRSQANSALGIVTPKSVDDLADFNFSEGLAEGTASDEAFVSKVKDWAVEAGVDTGSLQKMVSFFNGPLGEFARTAESERSTVAFEAKAKECNDALIADTDLGGTTGVAEKTELFSRAITAMAQKNGLNVEETSEVVQAMVDGGITANPKLAKIMLQAFAPMAAEGGTFSGDGSGSGGARQASPYEAKKARFPSTPDSWGKPTDSWDNESRNTKQALGYKEK